MNKMLAIALAVVVVVLTAGAIAVLSTYDSTAPKSAKAQAAKDPCFRIGKLRWCVRSTPDQIAGMVSSISDLTGNSQAVAPPDGIKEVDFNTPSVPGGVTRCTPDSTKQFFDCH